MVVASGRTLAVVSFPADHERFDRWQATQGQIDGESVAFGVPGNAEVNVRLSRPDWIYFPPETGHFVIFEGAAASYIDFRDVRGVLIEQPPIRVSNEE